MGIARARAREREREQGYLMRGERESKTQGRVSSGESSNKLKKSTFREPFDGLSLLLSAQFWLRSTLCALRVLVVHGERGKASEKRAGKPSKRGSKALLSFLDNVPPLFI